MFRSLQNIMKNSIDPTIDRSKWGDGPWRDEPDRVEWEHLGLPCLALRNHNGNWCGYVAVPPGHPLHMKDCFGSDDVDMNVHGGLTYAALCYHRDDGIASICHVPKPGEPDNVWWFGFDCGHAFDYSPVMSPYIMRPYERYDHAKALSAPIEHFVEVYRDIAYVKREVESLAEQLANFKETK